MQDFDALGAARQVLLHALRVGFRQAAERELLEVIDVWT
jgi:hypothetical protein